MSGNDGVDSPAPAADGISTPTTVRRAVPDIAVDGDDAGASESSPGANSSAVSTPASTSSATHTPGGKSRVIPTQLKLTGNPDVQEEQVMTRHESFTSASLHTPHHMGAGGLGDSNRTRGGTLCETPHEIRSRSSGAEFVDDGVTE
jgi:hypothetical protein